MRNPVARLSLQTRLFISIIGIIVLASVIAYVFIIHSVREAFSTFAVRSFTMQDRVLTGVIVATYNRTGSFDGVVRFLEETGVSVPLLIVDPNGNIAYPTDWDATQHRLTEEELARGQRIVLADGARWTLVPYRFNPERAELERVFLARTRQALWIAGIATAAAGLLISFLLRRQVTHPLRQLADASRRIAAGRMSERVPVRSADEFGRLAVSFNEMASSLEASEQAKKRMIADIAHELRTPIAAVRSALEGLRDRLIEPTEETFASLHTRILLLGRLVGDLHQLALADAGRLSIQRAPSSLEALIEGIVEAIEPHAEDAGLEVAVSVAAGIPPVDIDAHRIEQVLLNLLANAIRHTPRGGEIRIAAAGQEDAVDVSVCDTGSGIAPGDLPHIFDRFYRADVARTAAGSGPAADAGSAGLGLPIAKALIEAHGGRIWAVNRPEGGACLHFTLPLSLPDTLPGEAS